MAGRPIGRGDNPLNKRKQRNETAEQLNARIAKTSATRKENNARKAAEAAKHFFEPRRTKPNVTTSNETATVYNEDDNSNEDEQNITINNDTIEIVPAINVIANLDIDEDGDEYQEDFDLDDQFLPDDQDLGVQQQYVKAIQLRLREEVSTKGSCNELWLLEHLKSNGWWVRNENAIKIAKKLGLKRSYIAYYRDVYVWLPDVRWKDVNCMPCCPTCKSNEHVGNKGFHDKHFGRLIIGLRENYYAISRRYVCYSCMKKSDDIESVIDQSLNENENVSVEKTVDKLQYNFMGWNSQSLPLLPLGRGSEFPAFLSWKAGVDKTVIDMMRPLFDKGSKPESFSNMLLELHTSELLQNLVKENHGIQMFPHWTNASDYKSTNETFDTIALHHQTLDDKLEQRCRELGPIALTREQEYMSQAMGTRLPFLPFVSKEESLAYAEYVLDSDETRDYDQAAEDWIKYVNGKTVMPKLPAQLRTYDETWSRNMRIKECMKNARSGNEKIKELNGALTPQSRTGDGIMVVLEPEVPKPLPQPQLQAMKDASFEVVGGILVGENPMDNNRKKKRQRKCGVCGKIGCSGTGGRKYCPVSISNECKRQRVRSKVYTRQCSVCSMYGPSWLNCGRGSGNRTLCQNFNLNGDRKQL